MLELIDVDVSRIGALGPIVESAWVPQSKERGKRGNPVKGGSVHINIVRSAGWFGSGAHQT